MPASLYESLVREYLESGGYLVYTNLWIPPDETLDRKKEVDIVAFSPTKRCIVGEVKGERPNKTRVKEISDGLKGKMESLTRYVAKVYNIKDFDVVLYCWNLYEHEKQIVDYANTVGIDDVVTFPRIVKILLDQVKNTIKKTNKYPYDVNRPNTSLVRIIYDALSEDSSYLTCTDFKD